MYYLQSRYYDADVARFINVDEPVCVKIAYDNVLDSNLFAYCKNSCVSYSDETGYFRVKTWIVATSLDIIFSLLNHIMMAGYISLSGTIWILARSPFTKNLALKIVKNNVVPVFVRGFYNVALTSIRKVLQTFGVVSKEFAQGWSADKITNLLNKYINTRFIDLITSILTWGGIISLVFDIIDGKWDGYITV